MGKLNNLVYPNTESHSGQGDTHKHKCYCFVLGAGDGGREGVEWAGYGDWGMEGLGVSCKLHESRLIQLR